jgi:hypothetical protein
MHHQGWKDRDSSSYNYYGTSYAVNTLFTGTQVGQPLLSHSPYARGITQVPSPRQNDSLFRECGTFRDVRAQYGRIQPNRLLLE